jgi:protein TonB
VPRRVGGGVSAPVLVTAPLPEYTTEARAAKISGNVLVHFWVDENGKTTHVQVVRGLGHGLDAKALDVVRNYQFKPALEDGKPVVVALNTEINFQIF